MGKTVLLAPLDPVHDIGLKMIKRRIEKAGHKAILLPPDYSPEEVISKIAELKVETVLISRTLGYGVHELLSKFIDLAEASGIRKYARIGIGGMAIRPELAAELGFDAGFGPGTDLDEALAFIENREYIPNRIKSEKIKPDITEGYNYEFLNMEIEGYLNEITSQIIDWAQGKTTPAIERARIREEIIKAGSEDVKNTLRNNYKDFCDDVVKEYYINGKIHEKTRRMTEEEIKKLNKYVEETEKNIVTKSIQHTRNKPKIFSQYGTGCPFMDSAHIKITEAWGADGVVHFDPSWSARTEGYYEGYLTHQEDGSVITPENLKLIGSSLNAGTLWQIRAHRGLNTPETVVLAGNYNGNLTKINICYGSLGAGTDPERLTLDGLISMVYASKYKLPFDIVTNEELCGVPAYKAFAGMLVNLMIGKKLGARPILQPLFCYSPEVMITGQMSDNYVDFNSSKIYALRSIVNAPIWPGAPIGFLTQTEDRVQSSMSTALHCILGASLGVDAVSIASSDEAYSGGPITSSARVDTLKACQEAFRFLGHGSVQPTENAKLWSEDMVEKITGVLKKVASKGDFVRSLYEGDFGDKEDGAYPGRAGRNTVISLDQK
jgi:methylmalonyl-CoA mutase cobalamin-binding subunit